MRKKSQVYDQNYILDKLLELAYDGIVVVDQDGLITLISKAYADFLGVEREEVVGKPVADVIENTRLPAVLKSGAIEKAQLQEIKGDYMVATRVPLIENGQVVGAVGKVLFRNIDELNVLQKRIKQLREQLSEYQNSPHSLNKAKYSFRHIIGDSDKLLLARTMAEKAALTDSSVLLSGESGTGKELFAHAIHQESARASRPFIKINCSAIPAELLESELFGYEPGAFTGARKGGKIGKFEAADGGTLFLDEIGDMPSAMQAKLLRVLQEKEVEKIGSLHPQKVDVRVIAATNRVLTEMVEKGSFRADLYYRLNVVNINIPPLRTRPEDIEQLVPYLLEKICHHLGKYIEEVTPKAFAHLKSHEWPGNVRELENTLERAVNLIDREAVITPENLPENITGISAPANFAPLRETMAKIEKETLLQAINACGGNKAKAARLLKINRVNLYERLKRLGMR